MRKILILLTIILRKFRINGVPPDLFLEIVIIMFGTPIIIMSKISMIGNDMALDAGVGTCGKNGQSVPVGVGQPTLKIGGITVGGTQAA